MRKIFIDFETYSETDIKKSGAHKYSEDPTCEVILVGWSFDDDDTVYIGEDISCIEEYLTDPNIQVWAHNAPFERLISNLYYDVPLERFRCTMVLCAACGLPLQLKDAAGILGLTDKLEEAGKSCISYFCKPYNSRRRYKEDNPEKWELFKQYLRNDVQGCKDIHNALQPYIDGVFWDRYFADQRINEKGVRPDISFVKSAQQMCTEGKKIPLARIKQITRVENPNSVQQLLGWLNANGCQMNSLDKKKAIPDALKAVTGEVREVLEQRILASNTSVTKYDAILASSCRDSRCRGMFQFMGAVRTGRTAGRIIQLQNLKNILIKEIDFARECVFDRDIDSLELYYGDPLSVISQLIRTAFIPSEGNRFAVADFSAIEARVTAWLAGEQWRLDVFNTHGKIYEASAAKILGKPIDQVTKDERNKIGKVAELALGFGGWVGAFLQFLEVYGMLGLFTEEEIKEIILAWRKESPHIVELWEDLECCARDAISSGKQQTARCGIKFGITEDKLFMYIQLLSGRRLMYYKPRLSGSDILYVGKISQKDKCLRPLGYGCGILKTYGGKLCENVVQATATDLLQDVIVQADKEDLGLVLQVHDEVAADTPTPEETYARLIELMSEPLSDWAEGLPLAADGYIGDYYKK